MLYINHGNSITTSIFVGTSFSRSLSIAASIACLAAFAVVTEPASAISSASAAKEPTYLSRMLANSLAAFSRFFSIMPFIDCALSTSSIEMLKYFALSILRYNDVSETASGGLISVPGS